jgi:hypothetical protein
MNLPRQACVAVVLIALCAGMRTSAAAQWGIALDVQRSAYGGSSKDTTTNGPGGSLRPAKTQAIAVRVDRHWNRLAVGLGVRVARSAAVLDAPDIYVGIGGEFTSVEVLPEVRWHVARSSKGAALELYGGPVIGMWAFEDFGNRWVPGATVGVRGAFPIFDRLALSLRIGGSVLRSVFRDGELPQGVVTKPTRRSEIALGLRYGR